MPPDLARRVALALNVVFAVLLTAAATLLLVIGAVGIIGPTAGAVRSDIESTAYSLAVLTGVIGLALVPAAVIVVNGVAKYMRRESGRRLRAADFGLVAAYLLVAVWFGPLRVPLFVHGLGVAAIVALVALQLDIAKGPPVAAIPLEPEGEIRTAGGGWRARRRRR
ncbi:MAG: hypothetical protein ACJ77B_00615 [Chloroflexota bacterium]